jgi:hypothetical protein
MKVFRNSIIAGFLIGLLLGLFLSAFVYISVRAKIRIEHIDPFGAASMLCAADMAAFYAPILISLLGGTLGAIMGTVIIGFRYIHRRSTRLP